MALRGSLGDFGISEILQMIGHQKKSGMMQVRNDERAVNILFDSGSIVDAETQPTDPEYELSTVLVDAGLTTPSQMVVAKRQAKESLQPIEMVLLSSKAISLEDLKSMILLKNLEIIYGLFLWEEGEYSFDQQPVNYAKQLVQPISCEQVLMDGYRIKDEWPEVLKWLPDLNTGLAKVPGEFSKEDRLKEDMDRIYRLVDGKRTGLEIAMLSRLGRFEAAKILTRLIELERINPIQENIASFDADHSGRFLEIPVYVLFVLLVILFLAGAYRNVVRLNDLIEGPAKDFAGLVENMEIERLEYALDVHKLLYQEYPANLNVLISKDIIGKKDYIGPWGAPYIYKRTQSGYILESPVKSEH